MKDPNETSQRVRKVSLNRPGSEEDSGAVGADEDLFRASLVRDAHPFGAPPASEGLGAPAVGAGGSTRQRRASSLQMPGMVIDANDDGSDHSSNAGLRRSGHASGAGLTVPGDHGSGAALHTGARRRSFQTVSSKKSVSVGDAGSLNGAGASGTASPHHGPQTHHHHSMSTPEARRGTSVSGGSHTAGSATNNSTSLTTHAKRMHASRLEDQILGHSSSHVTDADYVRRVDDDGRVQFVRAEEATLIERLKHAVNTASLGMGARLIFTLCFCFVVSVWMMAFNFTMMSDDHAQDLGSYLARRHAQVTRDCALAIVTELALVAPAMANGATTNAVLTAQSSKQACDVTTLRSVALAAPSSVSSRFDESSTDYSAVEAAVTKFGAAYAAYSAALNAYGQSNVVFNESAIDDFATKIDAAMAALLTPLTARIQLRHTRFAAGRLTDVIQFTGVPARLLAPAVLWAAFATTSSVNASAGDPTTLDSASRLNAVGLQTNTAYIDALRRLNSIVSPIFETFGSLDTTLTTMDSLLVFMRLNIFDVTLTNFTPASSTPASRANQVSQYVLQAAPVAEVFDVEPTQAIAWVVLIVPLIVLVVICFVVYTVGRRYQQRANRTLQLEIAQRSALQRAISAFVPRHFLALMGYESIRNIRVGDHREVELTMIFFGVHNYSALSAGASSSKMFLLQQNLMTTSVGVSTRNGGFLDKFLGDGAFILFTDALAAVIASVELVQESQDLAVRRRKARRGTGNYASGTDSATSPSMSRENSSVSRSSDVKSSSTRAKKPKANAKLYAQALNEVPYVDEGDDDGDENDPKARSGTGNNHLARSATALSKSGTRREGPGSDNDSIEMDESPRGGEADMESSTRTTDSNGIVKFNRKERSADSASNPKHRRMSQNVRTTIVAENERCRVGVGIHTGLVCVGILGDAKRHSCTLISSKVNLASRLCKLTQKLRVNILLSREVYDACGEEIEEEVGHYLRPLGTVKVYGQKKECEVLEVFATDEPEVRDYKIATANSWRKGQDYRSTMQFDESQEIFRSIRSECLATVPPTVKGVDGLPFVDIPLDLHVKSRQRHHVFTEK